ncbi:MAG: SH3 domain-containing protein [Leptospirales bacterium]
MKRSLSLLIIFSLVSLVACGEKKPITPVDTVIGNKYAKYRVSIRKAADLKDWLATLEKAEEVELLEEFEQLNAKKDTITIAKVRLADDQIGYVESRYLANDPIVFVEDTRVFNRPASASKVIVTLPKGTIGFVLEEKDGWTKIYVGKYDGKWITKHWVESVSYSIDAPLVLDAREYETALALLAEKKYDEAHEKLTDLANNASFFNELAVEQLAEIERLQEEETAVKEAEAANKTETESDNAPGTETNPATE